jgi:hypothetical protein
VPSSVEKSAEEGPYVLLAHEELGRGADCEGCI